MALKLEGRGVEGTMFGTKDLSIVKYDYVYRAKKDLVLLGGKKVTLRETRDNFVADTFEEVEQWLRQRIERELRNLVAGRQTIADITITEYLAWKILFNRENQTLAFEIEKRTIDTVGVTIKTTSTRETPLPNGKTRTVAVYLKPDSYYKKSSPEQPVAYAGWVIVGDSDNARDAVLEWVDKRIRWLRLRLDSLKEI
jgi:hypothetical protein